MKLLRYLLISFTAVSAATMLLCSAAQTQTPSGQAPSAPQKAIAVNSAKPIKISIVNFKNCVEQSKLGKQEQANFEGLRKQMETVLEEKEKSLNEMATKFNDPDYLDSLSPEAETELKRKFRALNQELTQFQNQYYQSLNQTNFKVVQKLTEVVTKAAAQVAKDNKIDLILNEEGGFFYSPDLDISAQVISVMDQMFENESKELKDKPTAALDRKNK